MFIAALSLKYFAWHYSEAPASLFKIAGNLLWFLERFFSLKLLAGTLFVPWRRLSDIPRGGLDIGSIASSFIVNTIMRIVGFGIRLIFLLIGGIAVIAFCIVSVIAFAAWIFLPALVVFLVFTGFGLIV